MNQKDFWNDTRVAKEVATKHSELSTEVSNWEEIQKKVEDLLEFCREAEETGETSIRPEAEKQYEELLKNFEHLEFFLLFSEKYDEGNCIVSIHAGTGGTEAMDWAGMLARMILRFSERQGFRAEILDEHRGAEAGYKSITIMFEGRYAYGYLKSEHGVHRLVRISPFDAEKMRHTSFALIEALPVLAEVEEIKIDPKDLRVDTFLSSGHGGQSVQTTYSAVRVVHLPTGITVSVQNERSQTQNKETALKILQAKLHALAQAERAEEKQKIRGEYTSAEWGNQARSYVLHPYKLVKDHRTKFETSDAESVLEGKLEELVESYLRWKKVKSK